MHVNCTIFIFDKARRSRSPLSKIAIPWQYNPSPLEAGFREICPLGIARQKTSV
uniref:Uncharacterized protein n=1 Tax=Meloidogyne incognita TaxID=6306 RepID=A0A914MNX5_MELIC